MPEGMCSHHFAGCLLLLFFAGGGGGRGMKMESRQEKQEWGPREAPPPLNNLKDKKAHKGAWLIQ